MAPFEAYVNGQCERGRAGGSALEAKELIVGTALSIGETAFDVPPGAGFVTVTLAVPAMAISAAVIAAVHSVAFTNMVVLAAPLPFTTDVENKTDGDGRQRLRRWHWLGRERLPSVPDC